MDHVVYLAASGAGEAMVAQAINANNLANVSTVGFRADLVTAQSAYFDSAERNSRVFAAHKGLGTDFDKGMVNSTGRDLDLAINGEGWMTVMAPNGTEALTRRGDLRVNDLGQLVNGAGMQVMGDGGPLALPEYSKVSIGTDGTISVIPLGEDPNTIAEVDRINLVNPNNTELYKDAGGLIRVRGEMPAPDAEIRVIPGALESSNVDSVGAMVHMIQLARQFESHAKIMKVAEQLDASSAELMSLS